MLSPAGPHQWEKEGPPTHTSSDPLLPFSSQRLLRLVAVGVEAIGRELLNVCFGEAPGLGVSQPLCQV